MATIHVDGEQYEVNGADNLLQTCLSLGLDIPYFCWHPALGSVGACRQCAVKQFSDANDTRGRLVMSCMTPAANGTYISINDEEAKAFRESVVEWLMTNHPHDCPVCEEGGHCHLQDMTVMTGHAKRRYRFDKRTHQNQELGPFVSHEMNRCIACYRCVRYYKDYAGGSDLGVYGAHDNVYFGRETDGVLESEFSGNLTEVCPTGVFTDKTHSEHYTRKWDMQFAPSICQQCSVGCNISPGERYGEIRRIENRYNGSVNHYFLCDRGRFGYGYVNLPERPRIPYLRNNASLEMLTIDTALDTAANQLRHAKRIVGIGSPRASLESNYALQELVGKENFYSGLNADELALSQLALEILQSTAVSIPSLRQIEENDAIFVLGEDLTQTAPRIALALRQSVKNEAIQAAASKNIDAWHDAAIRSIGLNQKSPLYIASVAATRLDDAASGTYHASPDDLARLGFAVAHAIDNNAPAVLDLDPHTAALANTIATSLLSATKPLIIGGTSLMNAASLQAVANISNALAHNNKNASISLIFQEANTLGSVLLGGDSVQAALEVLKAGYADAVVVLENDLYRRADADLVDAALANSSTVIVVDHQNTATAQKASLVFSAASFAEGDGTLINQEGRAQRFFQVYDPVYYQPDTRIKESWRWLHALHSTQMGKNVDWTQLDEVTAACAHDYPALADIIQAAPNASYRILGRKVARQPIRYSGRTAMRANISVHEPRASQDQDSALAFSMEGFGGASEPGALIPFAWSPGWNSPQAWNKFQDEVGGHLTSGDPGVRLISPTSSSTTYYTNIPERFATVSGQLKVVPLYHIFGSEELSAKAAPIQALTPETYAALSRHDAQYLNLSAGSLLEIKIEQKTCRLPVVINDSLAAGTLGLPVGLTNVPLFNTATWASVRALTQGESAL